MSNISFNSFSEELTKIAFNWHGFKEGVSDEAMPLGGATIGAGLGAALGRGKGVLTGAALGYAVGGGASLLRSKLKGEESSPTRKVLAGSALGYGLGGLGHLGGKLLTRGNPAGKVGKFFHEPAHGASRMSHLRHGLVEEGLPAAGAILGTGVAMGTTPKKKKNDQQIV